MKENPYIKRFAEAVCNGEDGHLKALGTIKAIVEDSPLMRRPPSRRVELIKMVFAALDKAGSGDTNAEK